MALSDRTRKSWQESSSRDGVCLVTCAGAAFAQEPWSARARCRGKSWIRRQGPAGVAVKLTFTGNNSVLELVTDNKGNWKAEKIAVSRWIVRLSKEGSTVPGCRRPSAARKKDPRSNSR